MGSGQPVTAGRKGRMTGSGRQRDKVELGVREAERVQADNCTLASPKAVEDDRDGGEMIGQ